MSSAAPKAVLFDAYGTLFDVHSVALRAESLFPGHGARLSQVWRDKQIEYSRLVTTSNDGAHYQPFWALTEAALDYAINAIEIIATNDQKSPTWSVFGIKNGPNDAANDPLQSAATPAERAAHPAAARAAAKAQLMNEYRHLSAYPENRSVLQSLKARGVATGILSNGDPQMLAVAVKSAGLDDVLDHVISVDSVRRYKTHPQAYALGPQTLGLKAAEIGFVSSNGWDALAATWFGFQTLWVNRSGAPFETLGTQPTYIGRSLADVSLFF
jgi:2-haloacid dehalogenase